MENVLIIDGNNLLFQMFYGFPNKIFNKSKRTIHATLGFISYVLKQIKIFSIDKIIVVFDYDSSSERKEILDSYKANRTIDYSLLNDEDNPFLEEEYIIRCLDYLNIKYIYSKNMEADDLIASLAIKLSKTNKVIISSFDGDFYQLINDNISILRYKGKNSEVFNSTYFNDKFGFNPNRYVLFKSLTGDNADNIKGIDGIGKIRATKIVKICSTINEVDKNIENLVNQKVYKNYVNQKDILLRNFNLIKLDVKQIDEYSLSLFDYDKNKIKLKNSQILSNCKVFD